MLERYSLPLLDFIEWGQTQDHKVEVLNDTADYYRYFDATPQAEFLYDRVIDTMQQIIPREVRYLEQYDRFKYSIDESFDMPDKTVALLIRFLEQNNGKLSKRAMEKEFAALKEAEVQSIEKLFAESFQSGRGEFQ